MSDDRRLIEDYLPIQAIGTETVMARGQFEGGTSCV